MSNINKADQTALTIKQKYEEMQKQMHPKNDYGQIVASITAPIFPPLVRRHMAQTITDTKALLEAYGELRAIYGEVVEENKKLTVELNQMYDKLGYEPAEEDDEDCDNCENKEHCPIYMLKMLSGMDPEKDEDCDCSHCNGCAEQEAEGEEVVEDTMHVSVNWLDGSNLVFAANSIRQVKNAELYIDIEGGTVVIPMANVKFYSIG